MIVYTISLLFATNKNQSFLNSNAVFSYGWHTTFDFPQVLDVRWEMYAASQITDG